MELCLVRSGLVKEIPGELSAVFKALANTAFLNQHSHDLSLGGLHLTLADGSPLHVFLSIEIVISDEGALHGLYSCKGAAGLKPCLLCQNVFRYNNARSIVANDASGFAVHHTCHDHTKLVPQTPATLSAIMRRLSAAAGIMSRAQFAELETRLGWNYSVHGLMQEERLRQRCDPCRCACYDWMHVFFVSGIFNVHCGYLLIALRPFGVTYGTLYTYVSQWRWPIRIGNGAAEVLSEKRAKSSWQDGTLKATASEGLSLVPVLAQFLDNLRRNADNEDLKRHAACFLQLASIIDSIQKSSRVAIAAEGLQQEVGLYLKSFQELYGCEAMIPKFHFAMHLAGFLGRWGTLPNCYVLERKHKQVKRFANEVRNTSSNWESSVLREITSRHVAELSQRPHFEITAGLVDPHGVSKRFGVMLQAAVGPRALDCFSASLSVRVNAWERVHKGDVVAVRGAEGAIEVGQALWHVAVQVEGCAHTLTCVQLWQPLSADRRASKWRRSDTNALRMSSDIVGALIWAGDATVTTLKSAHV